MVWRLAFSPLAFSAPAPKTRPPHLVPQMRPNLDTRAHKPRNESPYTRTSTTPPPPARPRPSMALIALFTFQPRPPVPPPKSLTRNPLNATASSFAPKRRRKWVQASRMWSLGVVRLAGTKVCARTPSRLQRGTHQLREPNCGGGCGGRTRFGSGGKKLGIPSTMYQHLPADTKRRMCQREVGGKAADRHKKLTCRSARRERDREVGGGADDALDAEGRWGSTSWSGGGRRRELQGYQTFIIDLGARLGLVRACRGTPGRCTCMWLALMSSGNNELMRRDGRT